MGSINLGLLPGKQTVRLEKLIKGLAHHEIRYTFYVPELQKWADVIIELSPETVKVVTTDEDTIRTGSDIIIKLGD